MNVFTKDAMGKMFFTTMSTFVELKANLLSETTKKELEASRARSHKGGRASLPDHKKEKANLYMINKTYRRRDLLNRQMLVVHRYRE